MSVLRFIRRHFTGRPMLPPVAPVDFEGTPESAVAYAEALLKEADGLTAAGVLADRLHGPGMGVHHHAEALRKRHQSRVLWDAASKARKGDRNA